MCQVQNPFKYDQRAVMQSQGILRESEPPEITFQYSDSSRRRVARQRLSHVARTIQHTLRSLPWGVLEDPLYSIHVSPCDFHVFSKLKK
jgi:hypothetical protein